MSTNDCVVGIDLGASKIALSLVDSADTLLASRRFATESSLGPERAVGRIADAIAEMEAETGRRAEAVGACAPGPIDIERGWILDPPNLGWQHIPFRQMLTDAVKRPVALEHDAKAAALGEFHAGIGKQRGARDLMFIIVGTGVGGAVILDGQLYRGRTNSAGEIGHITLNRAGALGSSGVPGCVESYMSGPELSKHYQTRTGESGVASAEIVARARAGDADALAILTDAGDALGAAIATFAMLVDVDLYVVGGSVSRAGDLLLAPARAAFPKYAFKSVAARLSVYATELGETGPILGCAWQARQLVG